MIYGAEKLKIGVKLGFRETLTFKAKVDHPTKW